MCCRGDCSYRNPAAVRYRAANPNISTPTSNRVDQAWSALNSTRAGSLGGTLSISPIELRRAAVLLVIPNCEIKVSTSMMHKSKLRAESACTSPVAIRLYDKELIRKMIPETRPIQCSLLSMGPTIDPARWRVGRTENTVGASTANRTIPPSQIPSESIISKRSSVTETL
jgi:hypothetical protein